MGYRRMAAWLCLLLLLPSLAAAVSSVDDIKTLYEEGMTMVMLGDYEEAQTFFAQAGNYADAAAWQYYCDGMVHIAEADRWESQGQLHWAEESIQEAKQSFLLLKGMEFQDSAQLYSYCQARLYELRGLLQKAEDLFSTLLGTLDSGDRYLHIVQGVSLPTQAPEKEEVPCLESVPAHAGKHIVAYRGPGTAYAVENTVYIDSRSVFSVCGKAKNWYLAEMTQTRGRRIRFWLPSVSVVRDRDSGVKELDMYGRKAHLVKEQKAFAGPGSEYVTAMRLPSGTELVVFIAEGQYTMAECVDPSTGEKRVVWVETDSVSK